LCYKTWGSIVGYRFRVTTPKFSDGVNPKSKIQNPKIDMTLTYQQEEAQQILQLAFARQTEQGELSREQLLEIATELGISPECLQAAEQQWREQQLMQQQHQAFDTYRRQQLYHKLGKYAIINGFLISFDWLTGGGVSWSLYLLLVSGLWASLSAWKVYHLQGEAYDQAFQSWERKRQLKRSIETLWQNVQKFLQA
jgi:2TM domain